MNINFTIHNFIQSQRFTAKTGSIGTIGGTITGYDKNNNKLTGSKVGFCQVTLYREGFPLALKSFKVVANGVYWSTKIPLNLEDGVKYYFEFGNYIDYADKLDAVLTFTGSNIRQVY